MGQLKMTGDQIAARLEDMLAPNYAFGFRVIADTSEMVLLEAIAGNAEDLDNMKLEYKVHRIVDYVENGAAFYYVEYRANTGWSDQTRGAWRWSTHIDEPIPDDAMLLKDILAYDGLQLSGTVAINESTIATPTTIIPNANDWLHGRSIEPFGYTDLLSVGDAVEDIEEDR